MRIAFLRRSNAVALIVVLSLPVSGFGWGNEGHRLINRLAANALPSDIPAFLRAEPATNEIEYLGPEPDRWRSLVEPELNDAQALEHFLNLEAADALGPLPRNRFDYEALVFAHGLRPEKLGLQPWEVNEIWQRLKVALREYRRLSAAVALIVVLSLPVSGFGWGNEGHRLINRLAANALPSDIPAFLRAEPATNEIEYLGPEPDRWRSLVEPELNDAQALEHFLNLEAADALGPLPRNRFDYEALVFAHGLRPEKLGLQPWEVNEIWQRLKVALREYRRLSAAKQDTGAVEQAAIFYAGWLGYYVGDGSQPLHSTINYDGWTQKENPKGYRVDHGIHWRFEGTFVAAANFKAEDVAPKMSEVRPVSEDIFESYVAYLRHSQTYAGQVYEFDKAGAFANTGTPESRAFTADRLAAGASMLRDMIYTAWLESAKPARERF